MHCVCMKSIDNRKLLFLDIHDSNDLIHKVQTLYEASFPLDEQVPFEILLEQSKNDISDMYAIFDKDVFVGMLCTVYDADIVFLWYLAVEKSLQGQGYGSQILRDVANIFTSQRLILNIEEVDMHVIETVKRKQFYVNNGYKESDFKTEEYGVVYEMLSYRGKVTYAEYEHMMRKYSGDEVFERIYKLVE